MSKKSDAPPLSHQVERNTRWVMLTLVWLAYASFGITTGTIPPLAGPIIQDLGMTYSQMGLVLGGWQLVYILTATPLGALVDRLGAKRAVAIGLVVILLSLALRGLAVDFITLFAAVSLFGLGGPIISIGAPKVVALWFEGKERDWAAGIYTTAPICGMAISLATAPSWIVQLTGSWRGTSLVYGLVVLLVLAAWWIFARDTQEKEVASNQSQERESLPRELSALLHLRNMQIMCIIAILTFLLNHGLNNWIPALLQEGGRTIAEAGSLTAIATVFGAGGLLFILHLASYGKRKTVLGLLIMCSCATTAGLAFLTEEFLVAAVLLSAVVRVPLMPISTLILMETPGIGPEKIGRAGGLFFAAAEVGGFGGPLLLGYLRDTSGSLVSGIIVLAIISGIVLLFVPLIQEKPRESDSLT